MERLLKLALIQQHATSNLQDNIIRATKAFNEAVQQSAQLIAFSELAFTPFYPQKPSIGNNLDLAEPIPGPTTE